MEAFCVDLISEAAHHGRERFLNGAFPRRPQLLLEGTHGLIPFRLFALLELDLGVLKMLAHRLDDLFDRLRVWRGIGVAEPRELASPIN